MSVKRYGPLSEKLSHETSIQCWNDDSLGYSGETQSSTLPACPRSRELPTDLGDYIPILSRSGPEHDLSSFTVVNLCRRDRRPLHPNSYFFFCFWSRRISCFHMSRSHRRLTSELSERAEPSSMRRQDFSIVRSEWQSLPVTHCWDSDVGSSFSLIRDLDVWGEIIGGALKRERSRVIPLRWAVRIIIMSREFSALLCG